MPSETTPNCPTCGSEMRERELYVNEPPALECVQCRTRIYPHEMRTTPALATPPLAALTAERDALAKRCEGDRWVPVAERLPEVDEQVLCYSPVIYDRLGSMRDVFRTSNAKRLRVRTSADQKG